jgi:hypothetical protein
LPLGQRGRAAFLVSLSIDEMALKGEVIVDVGMDAGEFLESFHPPKPEHRSFSSAKAEMAIFGAVVQPPANFPPVEIAQVAHRCRIGSEAVGDNLHGRIHPAAADPAVLVRAVSFWTSLFGLSSLLHQRLLESFQGELDGSWRDAILGEMVAAAVAH